MNQGILSVLDADLHASGLRDHNAGMLIGHRDAEELVASEDQFGDGLVGLAGRRRALEATSSARRLRAAAQLLQEFLVETQFMQWPVCRVHNNVLLDAHIDSASRAIWVCSGDAGYEQPHQVAAVGEISLAETDVGYH